MNAPRPRNSNRPQTKVLIEFAILFVAVLNSRAHATAYYWDCNGSASGFGTATGVWSATVAGGDAWGFSTNSAGDATLGTVTTTTSDSLNFGTASAGLAAGAISVSGTVSANTIAFGSASGAAALSGGGSIVLGGANPTLTFSATTAVNTVISTPIRLSAGSGKSTVSAGGGGNNYNPRLSLTGGISGNSGAGLTFTTPAVNSGNWVEYLALGAACTYSGDTTVTTGHTGTCSVVVAGTGDNTLPTTTVLTIDGGAGSGSGRLTAYDLKGHDQTLAGLTNVVGRNLRSQRLINSSDTMAALTVNNDDNYSFSGEIGRAGTGVGGAPSTTSNISLTKSGSGTFTLAAANYYSGSTNVAAGILGLGNSLAVQNSPLDTINSVAGNAANGLKTTVTALTLGGLTGNKDFASLFTTSSGGFGSVTGLTLKPGSGVTCSYFGGIANGAPGTSLTVAGAGCQILAGSNTYSGGTTVSSGTLVLASNTSFRDGSRLSVGAAGNLVFDSRPEVHISDLYIQTGTDPTWWQLLDANAIPIGVTSTAGVTGSTIDVINSLVEVGPNASHPIINDLRIHTLGNSYVPRGSFPKWSRWYQEDGHTQIFRLFKDEVNVANSRPNAARIEAFAPGIQWRQGDGWQEWRGTYTIIKPANAAIFQAKNDVNDWSVQIGMNSNGDLLMNRRVGTDLVLARNMIGQAFDVTVYDNGLDYMVYYNGVYEGSGSWSRPTGLTKFRWGMYVGDSVPQSDAMIFVTGASISTNVTPPPAPASTPVPEPGSSALLAVGGVILLGLVKRTRGPSCQDGNTHVA